MNFLCLSSSRLAIAVSVCLTAELSVSKGGASTLRLPRGLWAEIRVSSHAEVSDALSLA